MITLGIIGVVAALTMPSLVSHYKKQETATRVKKFYSVLSQAIQMSEIDNGSSRQWIKESFYSDDAGNIDNSDNRTKSLTYFDRYLKKYLKYLKVDENPVELQDEGGQASMIKVYLSDGTYFYMNNGTCQHFIFDANGNKNPNTDGKDKFHFLLCPANTPDYIQDNGPNLVPWLIVSERQTRDSALQACKDRADHCSALLMMDGWEFKKDYPW